MTGSRADTAAQFSRQADAYAASASHATDADLDIVADFAAAGSLDRCLDVACGPGHTALRIALTAGFVVAADIAPGMLAATRRLVAERGLSNVAVQYADAAALPFPAAAFDLVTCRIAPHHFPDVPGFVRDVARVLKPAGRLVLEDSLVPEDPGQAAFLDELERRRDATHVRTLSRQQWHEAIADAGLRVTREQVYAKTHDFAAWVCRTGLDDRSIATLEAWALAAPAAARSPLLDIEGKRIIRLHDQKLIVRAEVSPAKG